MNCARCGADDAPITVVMPGRDGRQGSPGAYQATLCLPCDARLFVRNER